MKRRFKVPKAGGHIELAGWGRRIYTGTTRSKKTGLRTVGMHVGTSTKSSDLLLPLDIHKLYPESSPIINNDRYKLEFTTASIAL